MSYGARCWGQSCCRKVISTQQDFQLSGHPSPTASQASVLGSLTVFESCLSEEVAAKMSQLYSSFTPNCWGSQSWTPVAHVCLPLSRVLAPSPLHFCHFLRAGQAVPGNRVGSPSPGQCLCVSCSPGRGAGTHHVPQRSLDSHARWVRRAGQGTEVPAGDPPRQAASHTHSGASGVPCHSS